MLSDLNHYSLKLETEMDKRYIAQVGKISSAVRILKSCCVSEWQSQLMQAGREVQLTKLVIWL